MAANTTQQKYIEDTDDGERHGVTDDEEHGVIDTSIEAPRLLAPPNISSCLHS